MDELIERLKNVPKEEKPDVLILIKNTIKEAITKHNKHSNMFSFVVDTLNTKKLTSGERYILKSYVNIAIEEYNDYGFSMYTEEFLNSGNKTLSIEKEELKSDKTIDEEMAILFTLDTNINTVLLLVNKILKHFKKI